MIVDPLQILAHLAEKGTPPDDDNAVLRLSSGLSSSFRRIAQETFPFIANGGGDLQFVFGPYGRGKTHYLKALAAWGRRHGFATAYVDSQSPFASLTETYRAIASSMTAPGSARSENTGVSGVVDDQFEDRPLDEQRQIITRLKNDKTLSPDFRNLVVAYCSVIHGDDEYLRDRLEALLTSRPTYPVTLGRLYREHPHLRRPIGKLSRRNAALWLRAILSLPRILGYGGLLVFFDETEANLSHSRSWQRQTHLAHIRTFVDHMATGAFNGCAVYYTVTEDFIDIARRDLSALSQRIERLRAPEMADALNPRAVWVDIEELTDPGPRDRRFFTELGTHIVDIGREAGIDTSDVQPLVMRLELIADRCTESINQGRVRDFVKEAATVVATAIRG